MTPISIIASVIDLLIKTIAAGVLGFVANAVLSGAPSVIRGVLLTGVILLAAGAKGFVAAPQIDQATQFIALQLVVLLVQTALASAAGYWLLRTLIRRLAAPVA